MNMDFDRIKAAAEGYRADMSRFLREMISHPSESCEEKEVVACIKAEMEKLGYDEVEVDGLGNVIGWMGQGDKIIAIDSHIDTVGVGNRDNWTADPYQGWEDDAIIYGRGGSDQEGGMASATYGVKIMKDLGLIPAGYKIMVVGSVQEEDCDGMCWQYIVNKFFPAKGIRKEQVEFVISTEPTDGGIYRGHRGRMEIRVDVKGVSCHGSAPERGDNAIYKMADILQDVRALNENPADDSVAVKGLVKMLDPKYNPEHYEDARFLGRGTCTTSQIFYTSPSRCAVADSCAISIDRRMTAGETWDSCLQEIRDLPSVKKYGDDAWRCPCTCTTGPPGPGRSTRPRATSPPGSIRRAPPTSRPWWTPTTPSSGPSAWATLTRRRAGMPCTCAPAGPSPTSGPSPPTAWPFRAGTASPAWASAPAPRARPTPPMRSPGRTTWSAAPPCTPPCPASTRRRTRPAT